MKTKKLIGSILTVVVIAFMSSCSPEDGSDGVDGADGVDGIDGMDGMDGADGADGDDGDTGTANVIFSDWIDSEFDNNIIATGAGFDIEADELTQEFINEATILVYGRNVLLLGTPDVFPLPFITNSNFYSFRIEDVGMLRITIGSIDGTSIGTPFFEDYRYVIIPGGISAGGSGIGGIGTKSVQKDYAKMSYQDILAHFNIPE